MKKINIDKKIIKRVVEISQLIEGYKNSDKKTISEVKQIREKYDIKVSVFKK